MSVEFQHSNTYMVCCIATFEFTSIIKNKIKNLGKGKNQSLKLWGPPFLAAAGTNPPPLDSGSSAVFDARAVQWRWRRLEWETEPL